MKLNSSMLDTCRPKALSALREERMAAKQELKAISNVLSYAGVALDSIFPDNALRPPVPGQEERLSFKVGNEQWAFIVNPSTLECRWDTPQISESKHVRLVLCPDEGGPLYSGFQFLCHNDAAVALHRDESHRVYHSICLYFVLLS